MAIAWRRETLVVALCTLLLLTFAWSLHHAVPVIVLLLVYASIPFAFLAEARLGLVLVAFALTALAFMANLAGHDARGIGVLEAREPWLWLASLLLPTLAFTFLASRHQRSLTALSENHDRMRELASRLIQAQEAENSRIAREVHDAINQQLASISIGLSALKPKVREPQRGDVDMLQQRLHSTIEDVRQISRNLHPSVLRHVGLSAALAALCEHEAEQGKIALTFDADPSMEIPEDAALCLYRVAQEALRNMIQHSAADTFRVKVECGATAVELLIEDNGRGFDADLQDHIGRRGIGLSCMEERVRLLCGTLDIRSSPGHGCSICARLPLAP